MHCTGTAHSSIEHQHVQETARNGATIMALHAASKYHARWQGSLHFVIKSAPARDWASGALILGLTNSNRFGCLPNDRILKKCLGLLNQLMVL